MVAASSIHINVIFCPIYLLDRQVGCIKGPWVVLQSHGFLRRLLLLTSFGKLFSFKQIVCITQQIHCFTFNVKPQVGLMNAYNSMSIEPKCLYFPDFLLHSLQWPQSLSCYLLATLPVSLIVYTNCIKPCRLHVFTKKSEEDYICTLSCYNYLW